MATTGAVAHAAGNQTALELAAWAYRPGMPAELHSNEAIAKSDALAAKGQPLAPSHTGPLALGSPGRDRIRQALDMREARADDEGTPHNSPLALGAPGRDLIRRAVDMRNAREDDEPPPSPRDVGGAQAFTAWDNVTNRMENNQLHPKVEKALGPMQSALGASIAKRGGSELRAKQAEAFNAANRHFNDSHLQTQTQTPGDKGNGNHNRGTQNEANLKAIIANKQAAAQARANESDEGSD
jgi:hypothetical protein